MQATKAITRKPGKNFSMGITQAGLGVPDFELALSQHEAYCQALESAGLEVMRLSADDSFPDGCFVEDTAIVTKAGALICRPGDPSRRGETDSISKILGQWKTLSYIHEPGCLDGGDVLMCANKYYIGLSARTNREGAEQLAYWLQKQGYDSVFVEVSTGLHLKTGVTCPADNFAIGIDPYLDSLQVDHKINLQQSDAYAANCLPVNQHLLIPSGYPTLAGALAAALPDLNFHLLDMSEFEKMDGGLTCLSLLF